jgi:hypothetical protein
MPQAEGDAGQRQQHDNCGMHGAYLAAPHGEITVAARAESRHPVPLPHQRQRQGQSNSDQKQDADHRKRQRHFARAAEAVVEQDPRRNGEPDDKPDCGRVDLRMTLVEEGSVMDDKIARWAMETLSDCGPGLKPRSRCSAIGTATAESL